jgi:hypothetical protein
MLTAGTMEMSGSTKAKLEDRKVNLENRKAKRASTMAKWAGTMANKGKKTAKWGDTQAFRRHRGLATPVRRLEAASPLQQKSPQSSRRDSGLPGAAGATTSE